MVACIQRFEKQAFAEHPCIFLLAGYSTVFVTKLLRCGHREGAILLGSEHCRSREVSRVSAGAISICGSVLKTSACLISVLHNHFNCGPAILVVASFLTEFSLTFGVRVSFNPCSCLRHTISSVILAKIVLTSVFVSFWGLFDASRRPFRGLLEQSGCTQRPLEARRILLESWVGDKVDFGWSWTDFRGLWGVTLGFQNERKFRSKCKENFYNMNMFWQSCCVSLRSCLQIGK